MATSSEPGAVPGGRGVALADGRSIYVREVAGPLGAPTVLLVHAIMNTGGLTWLPAMPALGERYAVLVPDLSGHGRSSPAAGQFSFEACADDLAELLERLGTGPVVVVGYSMGGPISLTLWHRHPALVQGIVLCATAAHFSYLSAAELVLSSAAPVIRRLLLLPEVVARLPLDPMRAVLRPVLGRIDRSLVGWGTSEMGRLNPRTAFESIRALLGFDATSWAGSVEVPVAVVLTDRDRAVPPLAQVQMARAIPGAELFVVSDGHLACSHAAFVETLVQACASVSARIDSERSTATVL